MPQFLETICIRNGHPMHLDWHQRRVDVTMRHFYPSEHVEHLSFHLADLLASCDIPVDGTHRCRILYDLNTLSIEFFPYQPRKINSLKLVEAPLDYDYRFKYVNRNVIEKLFSQRGTADDILITRDGWITDTSIANIAFRKGVRWYTPSRPLLAGTTWKRLVSNEVLIPRPIHQNDLLKFDAFRIFNAMNDWGGEELSVESIVID